MLSPELEPPLLLEASAPKNVPKPARPAQRMEEEPLSFHSEAMQEVVGRVPSSILSWGTTCLLGIVLGFLVFSYFIEYPDLLPSPLVLKSQDSPKAIVARTEGPLERLFVKDGDVVAKGATLAYLHSTADVAVVEEMLDWTAQISAALLNGNTYSPQLQTWYQKINKQDLGEVQPSFQSFSTAHAQYQSFLKHQYYDQKRQLLNKEFGYLLASNQVIQAQKKLRERDLQIAEEELTAQTELIKNKAISAIDYKHEVAKVLVKKMTLKQSDAELIENLKNQLYKKQEILEIDKLVNEHKIEFLAALATFRSALVGWRQNYILTSPVQGSVNFIANIQEKQAININQELFYVTSKKSGKYGELSVPQDNFGKLRIGQKVIAKFDGYPAQQFGSVTGEITYISTLPAKNGRYLARVYFPQGLRTSRGYLLHGRVGMLGKAEVITQDLRLLDRFIQRIREAGRQ